MRPMLPGGPTAGASPRRRIGGARPHTHYLTASPLEHPLEHQTAAVASATLSWDAELLFSSYPLGLDSARHVSLLSAASQALTQGRAQQGAGASRHDGSWIAVRVEL